MLKGISVYSASWCYFDSDLGRPKRESRIHLTTSPIATLALCGVAIPDRAFDYGVGSKDCRRCARIAGRLGGEVDYDD